MARLGGILLLHLKSYEGLNTVFQNGRLNRDYFIAMMENRNVGLGPLPYKEPEYGTKQAEVVQALLEGWSWLEREGMLMRDPQQPAAWYVITRRGEELIIGGTQEVRDLAWKWVQMKEAQATTIARERLHALAEREPVLFVEKSRTMMASWWAVAEDMHYG